MDFKQSFKSSAFGLFLLTFIPICIERGYPQTTERVLVQFQPWNNLIANPLVTNKPINDFIPNFTTGDILTVWPHEGYAFSDGGFDLSEVPLSELDRSLYFSEAAWIEVGAGLPIDFHCTTHAPADKAADLCEPG